MDKDRKERKDFLEGLSNMRSKVVAVIPALNEEKTIENVVRGASKYVDRVIIVDDASSDNTAELARRSGATVLELPERRRVGAVIKAGLEYAKSLNPDIVVTLDADGQHNPEDVPRLIQAVMDGRGEWALGSRFAHTKRRPGNLKTLGNFLFSHLVTLLTRQKITDTMCGFRALSREALFNLDLKFEYAYCLEMTLILCLEGYRVVEVPIQNKPRKHGKSKVVLNILPYGIKQLAIVLYTFLRKTIARVLKA